MPPKKEERRFLKKKELFDTIGLLLGAMLAMETEGSDTIPLFTMQEPAEGEEEEDSVDVYQNLADAVETLLTPIKSDKAVLAMCREYLQNNYGIALGDDFEGDEVKARRAQFHIVK